MNTDSNACLRQLLTDISTLVLKREREINPEHDVHRERNAGALESSDERKFSAQQRKRCRSENSP